MEPENLAAQLQETAEFAQFDAAAAADFVNHEAQQALAALQQQPSYDSLAAFLTALGTGYLVVDVTGTTTKKKGTRARTIRATNGKQVLPIFTSMRELHAAVGGSTTKQGAAAQGAIMPAKEALGLVRSGPIVAIEVDAASAKQVVLRKFVELILRGEKITAAQLQS